MRPQRFLNNRVGLANWICGSANFNTFITLTLKQGLLDDTFRGQVRLINRDDCVRTAWLFRDRLTQRLLRSSRRRGGPRLPLAAFVEGGDVKRFHLHFVVARPDETTITRFRTAVCHVTEKLDWVHDKIDTREILYACPEAVVRYCLKEGTDAFLPEASRLHA